MSHWTYDKPGATQDPDIDIPISDALTRKLDNFEDELAEQYENVEMIHITDTISDALQETRNFAAISRLTYAAMIDAFGQPTYHEVSQ